MSNSRVHQLLKEGRINQRIYDDYMLFEATERGQHFMKERVEELFMEMPPNQKSIVFAVCEGRKSIIREIKFNLDVVKKLLEEFEQ